MPYADHVKRGLADKSNRSNRSGILRGSMSQSEPDNARLSDRVARMIQWKLCSSKRISVEPALRVVGAKQYIKRCFRTRVLQLYKREDCDGDSRALHPAYMITLGFKDGMQSTTASKDSLGNSLRGDGNEPNNIRSNTFDGSAAVTKGMAPRGSLCGDSVTSILNDKGHKTRAHDSKTLGARIPHWEGCSYEMRERRMTWWYEERCIVIVGMGRYLMIHQLFMRICCQAES